MCPPQGVALCRCHRRCRSCAGSHFLSCCSCRVLQVKKQTLLLQVPVGAQTRWSPHAGDPLGKFGVTPQAGRRIPRPALVLVIPMGLLMPAESPSCPVCPPNKLVTPDLFPTFPPPTLKMASTTTVTRASPRATSRMSMAASSQMQSPATRGERWTKNTPSCTKVRVGGGLPAAPQLFWPDSRCFHAARCSSHRDEAAGNKARRTSRSCLQCSPSQLQHTRSPLQHPPAPHLQRTPGRLRHAADRLQRATSQLQRPSPRLQHSPPCLQYPPCLQCSPCCLQHPCPPHL